MKARRCLNCREPETRCLLCRDCWRLVFIAPAVAILLEKLAAFLCR